jgi:D-glycero-D-manno-heptose 1,7-bisphosphate phosphatase
MVRRAVFLDRDGVINANVLRDGRPVAPTRLEDFVLLPGVEAAVARLKQADYDVIVVTNQPDVETGRTARAVIEAMHDHMRTRLAVDDVKACYHTDAAGCDCRKPKPGMILQAAAERDISLSRSWVVGDRWRDIEAGRRSGCQTIFVEAGFEQDGPNRPHQIVASLPEAVARILASDGLRAEPL